MTAISEDVIQEMIDDLVSRAADDWIMLLEVDNAVKRNAAKRGLHPDRASRIATGLRAIGRATEAGLMTPGDVIDRPPGFVAWEVSHAEALERIERGWRAAGEQLEMGEVCWLANTPAGNARAEDVWRRADPGVDQD